MKNLMNKIKNAIEARPLGLSMAIFMFISFFTLFSASIFKILVFSFSLLVVLVSFVPPVKKKMSVPFLLIVRMIIISFLLSSLVCYFSYNFQNEKIKEMSKLQTEVELEGYVTKEVYSSSHSSLSVFHVEKINGKRTYKVNILMSLSNESETPPFKRARGKVVLKEIQNKEDSFDLRTYYAHKGIYGEFRSEESLEVEKDEVKNLSSLLYKLRNRLEILFKFHFDKSGQGYLKALLLADKSGISPEIQRDFKVLGISHLLAVSGMHLSVFMMILSKFLLLLQVPKKIRALLISLFTLFFMGLCGFTLSVCRAGIMLLICMLGVLINEESDSFTSLFVAGGVITFLSPYSLFDFGFQLSFAATFGILFAFYHFPIHSKKKEHFILRILKTLALSFVVSFFAQISVIPLTSLVYKRVSLVSIPANLLFSPVFTLMMYLSVFAFLFVKIPYLSTFFAFLFKKSIELLELMASHAHYFKNFYVVTLKNITYIFIGLAVLLFLILAFTKRRKTVLSLLMAVSLLWGTLCYFAPRQNTAFLHTEYSLKNDLFILEDGGKSALVDLSDGSTKRTNIAFKRLLEYTGRESPDIYILTHYHQKHISTLSYLLENFYIDEIYLPKPRVEDESIYEELISKIENSNSGAKAVTYTEEDEISIGSFHFQKAENVFLKRSTHPAISFTVTRGETVFQYFSQSALEANFKIKGTILYFGVHGPITKKPCYGNLENRKVLVANHELYTLLHIKNAEECNKYHLEFE